ncbi:TPA: hypothetical protein N0F65_006731 [Lagenidium giganteum]|uniref:Elongator complex protein 2 n=1 Tax=Lagenidium giganteum TaxID=4803 RepID=A0AAV2Z1T5_9STRA|nr:TPA: hypothetical protein N0F65_006731 [Lagenidium giganteum]
MMTAGATLAHVAVGCNAISNAFSPNHALTKRVGNAATENQALVAAYGAKNAVVLVQRHPSDSSLLSVHATLQHRHETKDSTRVTSVFLHATPERALVLAGDSEGNVWLWQKRSVSDDWAVSNVVLDRATADSVAAVTAVATSARWLYVVAFSNGGVALFEHSRLGDDGVRLVSSLSLGVRMIMETLAASVWTKQSGDEGDVVIAAGGVDSKVHLFEVAAGTQVLRPLIALEGHRGWIRSVSFEKSVVNDDGTRASMFLASASQDQRVRLWKITTTSADDQVNAEESTAILIQKETRDGFQAQGTSSVYVVSFDALLVAHEDWVMSLGWTQLHGESDAALVSSSMDNTLIVWRRNPSSSWFPAMHVGEMGGQGLLGCIVLPTTEGTTAAERLDLLALSFSGQLERWLQQPPPSKLFHQALSLTGHCASVTDVSWSPNGDYLLSVSLDQTARILAPAGNRATSWHEVSRSQVHGYDINCACFLRASTDPRYNDRYVCGADEKILRVFEAPDATQQLVRQLRGTPETAATTEAPRVQHAYLPELSLTNKSADQEESKTAGDGYAVLNTTTTDGTVRTIPLPVGDTLGKKTLWPEQRKLYGHGNELLCVASNHAGSLVASACKSREERFASIWLWNTEDWSAHQELTDGHKSSVVQLAFAPNDQLLLSVSRDRQLCVFARQPNGKFALAHRAKAHKRIIWSCSWAPTSDLFATGARDQALGVWGTVNGSWGPLMQPLMMDKAVTAVVFAPFALDTPTTFVLAVGLENGLVHLYQVTRPTDESAECMMLLAVDPRLLPSGSITRLTWNPTASREDALLAVASSDGSVRLLKVLLP